MVVKNILKIIVKIFGGTNKLHYICVTKAKNMTHYIAIITEKGNQQGQIVANTKNGKYKGMSKQQFEAAVKNSICFSFEIKAI